MTEEHVNATEDAPDRSVPDGPESDETAPAVQPPAALSPRAKIVIVGIILLLIGGAVALRVQGPGRPPGGGIPDMAERFSDPVNAYDYALQAGKPIYVLFHSSTCPNCADITAASVEMQPDYSDSITFVDVLTDDPRARPLFSEFDFQFIPSLFFLAPDGTVLDSHTGPLTKEELRARLDALAAGAGGGDGS